MEDRLERPRSETDVLVGALRGNVPGLRHDRRRVRTCLRDGPAHEPRREPLSAKRAIHEDEIDRRAAFRGACTDEAAGAVLGNDDDALGEQRSNQISYIVAIRS